MSNGRESEDNSTITETNMKRKSIKYQVAEDLLITATSWERIFFNFVIKAENDDVRSFSLARIIFIR